MDKEIWRKNCGYMARIITLIVCWCFPFFSFGQRVPSGMFLLGVPDSIPARSSEVDAFASNIDFPPMLDWSEDGKYLLFNGGFEIYKMKRPNGQINEVEHLSEYFGYFRLSPDQTQLVFQEQKEGNEDYQIFLHDLVKKQTQAISPLGFRNHSPVWSPDGKALVYLSNQQKEDRIDLFLISIDDPESPQVIFENIGDDGLVLDWKSDGSQILLVKTLCEYEKELFLLDRQSGIPQQLFANQLEVDFRGGAFLESQQAVMVLSDQFGDHLNLVWVDLLNHQEIPLTNFSWDIESFVLNDAETWGAFVVNENGVHRLYRISLTDRSIEEIPFSGPPGIIRDLRMHPQKPEVAFNFYGSTFGRMGVSCDLAKKNWKIWTTEKLSLKREQVIEPIPFLYAGYDGEDIPAMVYWPEKSKQGLCPVWVDIHGGPEYQARPLYNPWYQYLCKRLGVAVVIPNIRGSSGYGKSYLRADDHFQREKAIEDVGALLDWINNQERLDGDRVLVHGQSYGGYIAMASLLAYPDQIKAGINVVGMADLVGFLENTRPYRKEQRRREYGDERLPEVRKYLQSISPFHAKQPIRQPLLMVQGKNDPRVPAEQADRMAFKLYDAGQNIWYLRSENEGHGFRLPANRSFQRDVIIAFTERFLLGSSTD